MDLLSLYNTVKSDKGKTPRAPRDWKKKILNPSAAPDDWDFAELNDNAITKRAQFNSQWEEQALCYVIQPVHCVQCGWQHDEHWGIFVHEVHRSSPSTTKFSRVTKSLGNYFHLPRKIVHNDPVKCPACDRCFEELSTAQLELPLNDIDPATIGHLADALVQVADEHEKHMAWKGKKQPEVYGWDLDEPAPAKATKDVDFDLLKAVDELDW